VNVSLWTMVKVLAGAACVALGVGSDWAARAAWADDARPIPCGSAPKPACRHCESYHGIRCYTPPPPEPCACKDPCTGRCHVALPGAEARAANLLAQLVDCHYRCRAKAACKLGSRLHVDFCRSPEIVPALVQALECDSCWVVRKEAAYAIAFQGVYDRCGWGALYLASQLDPHYLVREGAADALKVLETHISLGCIKEWKEAADSFVKGLKGKYRPGKDECAGVYWAFCGCPDAAMAPPVQLPPPTELLTTPPKAK